MLLLKHSVVSAPRQHFFHRPDGRDNCLCIYALEQTRQKDKSGPVGGKSRYSFRRCFGEAIAFPDIANYSNFNCSEDQPMDGVIKSSVKAKPTIVDDTYLPKKVSAS